MSKSWLYESNGFIAFAKTLPGYKKYIKKLYNKIQRLNAFQKLTRSLQGKHYKGFSKRIRQLHHDICKEESRHYVTTQKKNYSYSAHQSIIDILHTSSNQSIVANQINSLLQHIYNNVITHNIALHNDIEMCLDTALDIIKNTNNPHQFIFNTALVHHVACDIEDRIAQQTNDNYVKPKNNTNLLVRALEQFITRINPVTQIKGICESLVHTALFVADITLGELYLTREEYLQREKNFFSACEALSLSNLKKLTREQWVDIAAQCAADCVFPFGILKVGRYVKNIQRISDTSKKVPFLAKRLKNAVDTSLTKKPILVTPEGVIIKSTESMQQAGIIAQEVISDSRLLLDSMERGVLASVEKEIYELHHLFGNKIKGFGPCANKYLKPDFHHIFGIEFDFGKNMSLKIKGFHHDIMHAIQQKNILKFTKVIIGTEGTYSANLIFGGSKPIYKTFFPATWTRKEVVNAIYEAYNNFIKSGVQAVWSKDGKCKISSFTNNEIKIEIIITQTGKIVTAYPIVR